jgi:hypothetical protein
MASEFETNAGVGFDYDQPSPDPTPVIDAIRAQYRLPELTPRKRNSAGLR